MNRQKSPNSKRAPTHKGLRLSSRLAQRARAEESLVDSDHDVGRLDDDDGVDGAFLDGLDGALDLVASADLHDAVLSLMRNRPCGSAFARLCRLSFGDTCIIV